MTVGYESRDGIAEISFDRPDVLNAFNHAMADELVAAFHALDADSSANVGIIHGRGRAFSSGVDLRQSRSVHSGASIQTTGVAARLADLFTSSLNYKPVISAVHGYALGLGLALALEPDLVVAAEDAEFQVTETTLGLAGSRFWALMDVRGGGAFASEVALTGRRFSAREAFECGMINHVAPTGEHLAVATETARRIAALPPLGVRATVRSRRWHVAGLLRACQLQVATLKLEETEDFLESVAAFKEKRKPHPFKGR